MAGVRTAATARSASTSSPAAATASTASTPAACLPRQRPRQHTRPHTNRLAKLPFRTLLLACLAAPLLKPIQVVAHQGASSSPSTGAWIADGEDPRLTAALIPVAHQVPASVPTPEPPLGILAGDHGMSESDKRAGKVVAGCLLSVVLSAICIIYLVNYNDPQVQSYSIKLFSLSLSIFGAVLLEKIMLTELLKELFLSKVDMSHTAPKGSYLAIILEFGIAFCVFFGWYLAISGLSCFYKNRPLDLFAIKAFVSHVAAFCAMSTFGYLEYNLAKKFQKEQHVFQDPWPRVILSCCYVAFFVFVNWIFRLLQEVSNLYRGWMRRRADSMPEFNSVQKSISIWKEKTLRGRGNSARSFDRDGPRQELFDATPHGEDAFLGAVEGMSAASSSRGIELPSMSSSFRQSSEPCEKGGTSSSDALPSSWGSEQAPSGGESSPTSSKRRVQLMVEDDAGGDDAPTTSRDSSSSRNVGFKSALKKEGSASSSGGGLDLESPNLGRGESGTSFGDAVAHKMSKRGSANSQWEKNAYDGEHDARALVVSFFIRQAMIFIVTGQVPNQKGYSYHAPWYFFAFFSALIIFALLLLAFLQWRHAHKYDEGEEGLLESNLHFEQLVACMTIGWSLLTLVQWGVQEYFTIVPMWSLGSAAVGTPLACGLLILADKLVDHEKIDEDIGLSIINACGFLIGFAWEVAFAASINTLGGSSHTSPWVDILQCSILLALIMPAWKLFIVPHAIKPVPPRF